MLSDNPFTLDGCTLPTLMNDWTGFKEKWFNESQIEFADSDVLSIYLICIVHHDCDKSTLFCFLALVYGASKTKRWKESKILENFVLPMNICLSVK